MSYFKALGLADEPFSNSPNPDFFYRVPGRTEILNLLEVSIRLRRGLNVVMGEVGTGKTTLCRQFLRIIMKDESFEPLLLLDPYFESPLEFLKILYFMLFNEKADEKATEWQLKEEVKNSLLQRGAQQNKVVVLIIDEGQKIQDSCLELLRELLNFETNENKLLQIVIFAQNEFQQSMEKFPNLVDRIDSLHKLHSLSFFEMRDMIRYRIQLVSKEANPVELFTTAAYWAIYRLSKGFPRKVVSLCHKTLLQVIMENKKKAVFSTVYTAAGRKNPIPRVAVTGAACAACLMGVAFFLLPDSDKEDLAALWQSSTAVSSDSETTFTPPALVAAPADVSEQHASLTKDSSDQQIAAASGKSESSHTDVSSAKESSEEEISGVTLEVTEAAVGGGASQESITSLEAANVAVPEPHRASMQVGHSTVSPDGTVAILGTMKLAKGELLSKAISKVYGIYRKDYLEKVLAANPQITDPDRVNAGTSITFPAVASVKASSVKDGYWLRLAVYDDLASAAHALRNPPLEGVALRLAILKKGDASSIRFYVMTQRRFASEDKARELLSSLPESLRKKAVVLGAWEPDTIFFNDESIWESEIALR